MNTMTIAESIDSTIASINDPSNTSTIQSYKDLTEDPRVLYTALLIGDLSMGVNDRILRALCLGILTGIASERSSDQ